MEYIFFHCVDNVINEVPKHVLNVLYFICVVWL